VNCVRFCFFGVVSLWFVCVKKYIGNREFAPNSQGRRVWSLAGTSLKVKVRGQGYQGQKTVSFGPFGGLRAVYIW